jgi:hypothetical protein
MLWKCQNMREILNKTFSYSPIRTAKTKLFRSYSAAPVILFSTKLFYSIKPLNSFRQLNAHLSQVDPDIYDIIEKEKQRQRESIVLIPSENFTSLAVFEALGSVMQNKYSEGYVGARYVLVVFKKVFFYKKKLFINN